jgi:hypothetical protein
MHTKGKIYGGFGEIKKNTHWNFTIKESNMKKFQQLKTICRRRV